jgi:hypothetical protein
MTDIAIELAAFTNDPLGFVMFAFPWGEVTGELENFTGPEPWQREVLTFIRDKLAQGADHHATITEAIQIATTSGHGIGKSALVSWLILWSISTFEDTRGVVTANTETQLKTKTWAELGKWFRLFIGRELFKFTATAIFSADANHERTWRIDMVPWSERNTEAFAGLHNKGRRVVLIMDEASAIPDVIWETAEGALTDANTQILWAVFGNPTKATGRFRECFGKLKHRWKNFQVDSRTVSITNKDQFKKWIEDYGEDSDFVRVRVRGIFPRVGSMQFIGTELASEAARREISVHVHDPLIIGVDVARFGDDESVIFIRKGRDGRSIAPVRIRGERGVADTMTVAGRVAELYGTYHADAVFVDGGGVGGGVVDRLRQLQIPVWDIQFGSKSDANQLESDGIHYANKRAEIWGAMKEWLKGGCIEDEPQLIEEITGPQYGYNVRNEIQLEAKDDMKRRGLSSPDIADALALTFSYPVMPSALRKADDKPQVLPDYDPLKEYEAA